MDVFLLASLDDFLKTQEMIDRHALPIFLCWLDTKHHPTDNKTLLHLAKNNQPLLLSGKKTLQLIISNGGQLVKSAPNWHALQKRIVCASRKNELLLRALKINNTHTVLDATAGFGHDSLLLASTGARVFLLEKSPLVALLLFFEYHKQLNDPNWQSLLQRMTLGYGDFLASDWQKQWQDDAQRLKACAVASPEPTVIYLDPMFPKGSYKAKIGKTMQALHHIADPPTLSEECLLFAQAQRCLQHALRQKDDGAVLTESDAKKHAFLLIKRPLSAPYFAQRPPTQSWNNGAVRFDKYDVGALTADT